jgi:hypothetical protein
MNYNLSSAIAVREREDGLLEKDTFDLSTAVPIDNFPKPVKQNWELLKDPSFKADWELVKKSAIGQTKDIYNLLIGKPLASITGQSQPELESLPEVLPNLVKVLSSDIPIPPLTKQNIKGVLTGKGIVEPFEPGLEGNLDVLGGLLTLWGGVSAVKSFTGSIKYNKSLESLMKSQLVTPEQAIAQNIAQDLSKYEKMFVGEGTEFAPGTPKDIKVKTIMGNLKDNPKLQAEVMTDTSLRVKGIDPNSIIETSGVAIEEGVPSNMFGKLKRLNQLIGETGSIPITRAKVGQKIVFEGRPGEVVEVNGERLGIQLLGEQGRTVVATLSQLSLPKVEQPTGEGQKPPVEPPKTAVSGGSEENPKPIIKNLNISEEAKINIEEVAGKIKPELEKVKGNPLTHDEVVEAAQKSDILSKVVSREESKNFEARILRTRQHLASMAEGKGVTQEFIDTLKTVKSFGTDVARKLGSLRIGAEANEFNIKTKLVNDLLEKNIEIDDIIKASEGIDFNNQEQVTQFYRQFVKPKVWDLLNEYRYINLLSSPKTHIVNTFSNLIQVSGLAPGTKLFAGDVKGATAFYRGAWNSIGDAGVKALDALKGKSFVERPDITHIPTGSKLLRWGRWIPQALEASDVFFRTIAYEGELTAQLGKGVDSKEAEKIAKDKASYYVFRKSLDPSNKTGQGKLLSAIDNLTTLAYKARAVPIFGKLISWYIPFVQTPMNIAKQMIEYSPIGFATLPGAKDKKGQLAKAFLGSLIFGVTAYLVSKNDSTWSVPTSKKEKELFFAAGRQPFSIKIGNTWVGYSRLGPLAFPIAIPAAIKYYTQQNPNSATDNNIQKTSKVIGGLGEFFASMSYAEGIGQLMDLVKNAPGAAARLVGETPSQLIPLSSLQRWINNFIIDPIYRKTDKEISVEAIIDNARKSIIFATKGLPAYETAEGEESRRSYPGLNAFSPIPVTKSNTEYEEEYKQYIEGRKETLIDKKDSGDEPRRKASNLR